MRLILLMFEEKDIAAREQLSLKEQWAKTVMLNPSLLAKSSPQSHIIWLTELLMGKEIWWQKNSDN